MPDERRNPADDPLIRYWDQLVRGDAAPPIDLDPTLVETIHRFRGLDDAPAPDPAFLTRLQEDLMPTATFSASLGSGALSADNPRAAPQAHATWNPALPAVSRRHWTVSQLATAALLVLTLGSVLVAFLWLQDGPNGRPAAVPAVDATPGLVTGTPVVGTPLLEAPLGPTEAQVIALAILADRPDLRQDAGEVGVVVRALRLTGEDGVLVYEVELTNDVIIAVDATNGRVLAAMPGGDPAGEG